MMGGAETYEESFKITTFSSCLAAFFFTSEDGKSCDSRIAVPESFSGRFNMADVVIT